MTDGHPFARLAGTYTGSGTGEYPTIERFEYTEELVIAPVPGRPVAHWRSTTRDASTGEPRHAESGFLRAVTGGVELVVAHSFGIVETAAGAFAADHLTFDSIAVVGTVTAKQVDSIVRRYERDGDELRYTIGMAAVGVPMTHHLRAALHRR